MTETNKFPDFRYWTNLGDATLVITDDNRVGINVGDRVIFKSAREWFCIGLATDAQNRILRTGA